MGKAQIPDQRFENPDGTKIVVDKDYFGKKRNLENPLCGPFNLNKWGSIRLKVWPRNNP